MARPYGEGIVFNMLMKVIYVAYLAMYMAYAVLNYIAETGNDLVNFIVLLFISISIVIFIIANVLDWVYKNADARSKIKVRLHTLRNMFKIIKVGVTILVLAQTITDDSWNALTIAMLVLSLPTSLLWLLGEYIYVAIKSIFHRGGKKSAEDTDEEYDGAERVTPVRDTIERVKRFAESELIVMRPHEVDYDSDEQEDVEDKYLGYEEDDDFSYPSDASLKDAAFMSEKPVFPEYTGVFTVEEMPLDFGAEKDGGRAETPDDWQIEEVEVQTGADEEPPQDIPTGAEDSLAEQGGEERAEEKAHDISAGTEDGLAKQGGEESAEEEKAQDIPSGAEDGLEEQGGEERAEEKAQDIPSGAEDSLAEQSGEERADGE